MGPKGLYGLERLLSHVVAAGGGMNIQVDLFNRNSFFGAGDIYRSDQPEYLLMNFPNGYINMWAHRDPEPIVPHPCSFLEWLKDEKDPQASEHDYSSRACVGEYLQHGYNLLKQHCPEGVTLNQLVAEVVDMTVTEEKSMLVQTVNAEGVECSQGPYQQLLLATGHPRPPASMKSSASFVPFIYPVDQKLSAVGEGSTVAIKGMGLTFMDAVLALTEGRGGRFHDVEGLKPRYEKSGKEPAKIFPFSLSGLLMMPRSSSYGQPPRQTRFVDWEHWQKEGSQRQLDFEKDLWPTLQSEISFAYYESVLKQHDLDADKILTPRELDIVIDVFHRQYPEECPVNWQTLTKKCNQWTPVEFLEKMIEEARKGEQDSGWVRSCSCWKYLSASFNQIYSNGGFTPESHRFFDTVLSGHLNRLAYGPPLVNMQKVLCLAKAGLVDFSFSENPDVQFNSDQNRWDLQMGHRGEKAELLVDARIPKINLRQRSSALYENLLDRGIIRLFTNRDEHGNSYQPGCLDLSPEGHPLNRHGQTFRQVTVQGTPTEGFTYDNDTLLTTRNDFVSDWGARVVHQINASQPACNQETP
ncbi:FAD/NAD(P)-binding protein [Kiritimatiellaeota bacterium B1221]|nr:FAD/NAD(P)-binding protein [Kiritimatiellaeota bacterium B1221]